MGYGGFRKSGDLRPLRRSQETYAEQLVSVRSQAGRCKYKSNYFYSLKCSLMIIEETQIGQFYGINREIILRHDAVVSIRFYALGNDQIDLEFHKKYMDISEAKESLNKYIIGTAKPTQQEIYPVDNNWQDYEKKVNDSVILLFRQTINGTIFLPDGGVGVWSFPKYHRKPNSLCSRI